MDKEVGHKGLQDLRITSSMHERKCLMAELSDGFLALPGGIGTLEETFEVWTWAQLGDHRKPCGLFNVECFYDGLSSFLDTIVEEGFLKEAHRKMLISETDPKTLLATMMAHVPPPLSGKWIASQTAE